MTRTRWWSAAALLLILVVLSSASCRSSAAAGVVDDRLGPCPSTPNCVNSEDHDEDRRLPPLAFDGDPDQAFASLVELLRREPRAELLTVEDDYVHAVFRSLVFRFPDDLELRLDRNAGVVHVRSAARVGFYDFGANRKRLESIRRRWLTGPGG